MQRVSAKKVLDDYAKGERNFQRCNLRGAKFKGADLSGADFSECELHGANFARATLTGAKFYKAKAGLQKRWAIVLAVVALLLSAAFAFIAALFVAAIATAAFDPDTYSLPERIAYGVSLVVPYPAFAIVSVRRGISAGFGALALALALAGAGAAVGSGS